MTTQLTTPTVERPPTPDAGKGKPLSSGGRVIRNAWRIALLLLICFVACEGIMMLSRVGEEEFVQIHPVLGYWHEPNLDIAFRREGYGIGHINSAGFRGAEVPLAKPPGVVRIAALGDSKTEAFQVDESASFVKLLEKRLNQETGRRCEVLNFGMSAYSTGQEYLLLKEKVLAYKPDIVLLEYNVGDSDENTTSAGNLGLPRPYFRLDPGGTLSVDWDCMRKWMDSDNARFYYGMEKLRHTRFWCLVSKMQLNLASDSSSKPFRDVLDKPWAAFSSWALKAFPKPAWEIPTSIGTRIGTFPAPPPLSEVPHDADPAIQQYLISSTKKWPVTAAILSAIDQACKESGARLIVAGYPAPTGWQSHLWELRQIKAQAAQEGFTFVDINKVFPSIPPGKTSPLYLKTHFSIAGHRLMADGLYRTLAREVAAASK